MDAIIEGGTIPKGRVRISGAKNSATRLLSAAMLTEDTVHLGNFPLQLVDVRHKLNFAKKMGVSITESSSAEVLEITSTSLNTDELTELDFDVPT